MTHRFPLGDSSWFVWHDALLRSTGFPAAGLDRLAGPECAAVADAYLAGTTDQADFLARFDTTVRECAEQINLIAADVRVREAITWQNPAAVQLLDSLQRSGPPGPRNSKRRYRELQLTRYWQRYCGKTETIGFFGPGCWITLDPAREESTAEPGPGLLAKRKVTLEPWALTSYAAVLAEDPAVRVWLPPAPMPHFILDSRSVRRPGLPPVDLSTEEAAALALCDGRRPGAIVAAALAADPALAVEDTAAGYRVLDELVRRKLLKWDANLALGPHTGTVLAERIAAIGDDELRARVQSGLDRLTAARDAVAAAAGDPEALAAAMSTLDSEFVAITGREPRRRPGRTYAGRGLCYEDTARDVRVVIGRRFLDGVAPALSVMLQVARWFTSELARTYEEALQKVYAEVGRPDGRVTLGDLWYPAIKLFWEEGKKPVDEVLDALESRLAALFRFSTDSTAGALEFSAAELRDRLPALFPAERPGWSLARIHSPDLHVCATSAETIDQADTLVVLGEMHIANATLSDRWCTWSREDPGGILALAIEDFGQPRHVPLFPPVWSRDAGRNVQIEDAPTDRQIGFAKAPGVHTDRVTPMDAVDVSCVDGRLVGTMPDGQRVPVLEFFAHFLSTVAANALRGIGSESHSPRVTIDRLVVFRQAWRMSLDNLSDLMSARGEAEQYLAGRRLMARLGLPERCFVRISTETKPVYVDFTSPLYVASLGTMLRAAQEARGGDTAVTISEMLPTPDLTWVADRDGQRYFGELRLHLTDPELAATVVS